MTAGNGAIDALWRDVAEAMVPGHMLRLLKLVELVTTGDGKLRAERVHGMLPDQTVPPLSLANVLNDDPDTLGGLTGLDELIAALQTDLGATQPLSAILTALAAFDATQGLLAQTGATAFAKRFLDPNYRMQRKAHQQAADNASTAATATFTDAMSTSITLPGTSADKWTVRGTATLAMKHSASGAGVMRAQINGDDGPSMTTQALSSTVYGLWVATHVVAAIDGGQTITLKVQYHSGASGTTSAANPALDYEAVRTA